MPKISKQDKADALSRLRAMLIPGETVYTVLRNVSRSGMSRSIDLYIMRDNSPVWISRLAARSCGFNWDAKREALKVEGCGMDMGFHAVYTLGECVWPKGTDAPHGMRNGEPDSDGGYALKYRWL